MGPEYGVATLVIILAKFARTSSEIFTINKLLGSKFASVDFSPRLSNLFPFVPIMYER
jgi:hypothetical protein